MARAKAIYLCEACGASCPKWQGQCPDCGAWNALSESKTRATTPRATAGPEPQRLDSLESDPDVRYPSGFLEFDRVLGGGLVPGSVVLLGGDPGVGKSTLLQQVAARLAPELRPIYATGEESLRQVADRAHRLGDNIGSLSLLADTSLDNIIAHAVSSGTRVLVIDSIQTIVSDGLDSAPGSVSQLRECVGRIVRLAKEREVTVLLIGHVTKEGAIAGPRVVEHMVDTVLYFENDPSSRYTVVRAVKNRFGASAEMGVLAMSENGFREVRNPSAIFLSGGTSARSGSVVSVTWEGSRPLLVEIQALVAECAGQHARRLAQGVDQSRLSLLVAVLQRHGNIALGSDDVFVNVAGGLRIGETAADLPVLLAVISSFRDRPIDKGLVSFGEIGLAGEIRPVRFGTERLAEAAKQGYTRAVVPVANRPRRLPSGIDIVTAVDLPGAIEAAFE